ncbi:MAG: glycosyltransferase [Cyanobacteria bacterium P01_G01_bin.39]
MTSLPNLREEQQHSPDSQRILIFELSVGGHYPEYIAHLVSFWCEHKLSGCLNIVVVPEFFQRHRDVVAIAELNQADNVKFMPLTPTERSGLKSYGSAIKRNLRAWQEFNLINKYARKLQASHVFLPYLDTRMLPLALGRSLPCPFSGIYFRPTFHYPSFDSGNLSWKERLQHIREKVILSRVLRQKQLKTLYSLDPLAVEQINRLAQVPKAKPSADPVQTYPDSDVNLAALKSKLGIDPSRQVHLLFGNLNKRKGLEQVLTAIALMRTKTVQKLCLLLVGSMSEENYRKFQLQKTQLTKSQPVEIIDHNQYVPEPDIQNYFALADVILAPYQRHVGMSGILNRAAVARKPVLSTDYGLMGEITRRYQLGLTVDSSNPQQIAQGLSKFLETSTSQDCSHPKMAAFASQNSVTKFTTTIFQDLGFTSWQK